MIMWYVEEVKEEVLEHDRGALKATVIYLV